MPRGANSITDLIKNQYIKASTIEERSGAAGIAHEINADRIFNSRASYFGLSKTIIEVMNGQITEFIKHHYRHFNAAALIDAAQGYRDHLEKGGKMMITLAGAMSTAELGLSLAEMIRQDKVQIISCTGANLEEDLFNLVAHDFYERVPNYRDLTAEDEQALLDRHMNRVTDT